MKPVPTMFAVQQAAQESGYRILTLQFEDAQLNTELHLDGPEILTVISPVLPSWPTLLIHTGISAEAVLKAQQYNPDPQGMLQYLIKAGQICMESLRALAYERIISAMVPLYWHLTSPQIRVAAYIDEPAIRTNAQAGTTAAAWHALTLTSEQRALRLSDHFTPSSVRLREDLSTPLGLTYHAAANGLNLAQMAQRLPLRWDVLTGHVTELIARQVLTPRGGLNSR
ncbi:hypothetical protein E5F05_04320 (plasmid) [Deinococcus metallilatus]|uniref:Uncharacterized protein n=1 Tax=Deinococcus metallilatus TaxID=1211322 RepID=A0AAJ5JZ59_9DEIO|nr:hypothetical protein [Deinococcus metallilatus]MBB5293836.1 hypothetical protein [Deinococcus metallilatus]QBY07212.1 hypothetical protein E5F05_04320 [Deinococcus metallilatus]RXJ14684.1 hypothetical protein ERJ73_03050 [Deinococcus metallilatus]TLK30804.1 hypothetical protein FCS05_03365 [Deinococcus metallilatus]GMA17767.1 hypothetical protein GCM10025871_40980 [Deinococcus metallilatus]